MDRSNIEKIAKTPEDRVLLAKIWDKINAGMRKNIPANTTFLTLRELCIALPFTIPMTFLFRAVYHRTHWD